MNDLVGRMCFLEIANRPQFEKKLAKLSFFREVAHFGGDFKETHASYEVVDGDQYGLE